jgi:hypothetical protein
MAAARFTGLRSPHYLTWGCAFGFMTTPAPRAKNAEELCFQSCELDNEINENKQKNDRRTRPAYDSDIHYFSNSYVFRCFVASLHLPRLRIDMKIAVGRLLKRKSALERKWRGRISYRKNARLQRKATMSREGLLRDFSGRRLFRDRVEQSI